MYIIREDLIEKNIDLTRIGEMTRNREVWRSLVMQEPHRQHEERKDSTRLPFKLILWLSTTNVAIISSIIDFGVTMSPIRIMKNHPVICTHNMYIYSLLSFHNISSRSGFQCPTWS